MTSRITPTPKKVSNVRNMRIIKPYRASLYTETFSAPGVYPIRPENVR
jgi:hypothetical protein